MSAIPLRSICKVAFTFAGTLIGAGFASGQELLQFFITYGNYAFIGIFCTGLLFSWLCWRLLTLSHAFQLQTYTELIHCLCGKRIGYCLEYVISGFLFTVLVIMLAGAGNIAEDLFALPSYYGQLLLSVIIILSATKGVLGIARINLYVTPFLAIIIAIVSLSSLNHHGFPATIFHSTALYSAQPAPHWLLSCILYVSYNLALSTAVLVPLGKSIADPTSKKYGSILGGLLLAILSFLIISTLLVHCPDIHSAQIPMLSISCTQNAFHAFLYTNVFIIAMSTTALSCLYGCACKLKTILPLSYPLCLLLTIGGALSFTQIGFSQLIATAFPFFGYATLWILVKLLLKHYK